MVTWVMCQHLCKTRSQKTPSTLSHPYFRLGINLCWMLMKMHNWNSIWGAVLQPLMEVPFWLFFTMWLRLFKRKFKWKRFIFCLAFMHPLLLSLWWRGADLAAVNFRVCQTLAFCSLDEESWMQHQGAVWVSALIVVTIVCLNGLLKEHFLCTTD